jgi:hypothetical protein
LAVTDAQLAQFFQKPFLGLVQFSFQSLAVGHCASPVFAVKLIEVMG